MKTSTLFILGFLFCLGITSCKKVEGPGGSSSITGNLQKVSYNSDGSIFYQYDLAKEDVYIIYGNDDTVYDDDVETSYDGNFRFDYLEKGKYQVFVYEKCIGLDCKPGEKKVLLFDVEISDKKSTIDLGTIYVQ